jgi:hypothetical protein
LQELDEFFPLRSRAIREIVLHDPTSLDIPAEIRIGFAYPYDVIQVLIMTLSYHGLQIRVSHVNVDGWNDAYRPFSLRLRHSLYRDIMVAI